MRILNKKEIGIKGYMGESGLIPENRIIVCPHCKSTLEITHTQEDWSGNQIHLVDAKQPVYITRCPACQGQLGFYSWVVSLSPTPEEIPQIDWRMGCATILRRQGGWPTTKTSSDILAEDLNEMAKVYTLELECINCDYKWTQEIPFGEEWKDSPFMGYGSGDTFKTVSCPNCGLSRVRKVPKNPMGNTGSQGFSGAQGIE